MSTAELKVSCRYDGAILFNDLYTCMAV